MTEFQTALLLIGALVVVGVFAFNKWQETKATRAAEEAFRSEHPDSLLHGGHPEGVHVTQNHGGERIEPGLDRTTSDVAMKPADAQSDTNVIDATGDYLLEVTGEPAIAAAKFVELWGGMEHRFGSRASLSGMLEGEWRPLTGMEDCAMVRARLQLVTRKGVISEGELLEFRSGIESIADKVGASCNAPEMRETLERARELDAVCAEADIQIAFHVIASAGATFPGTKLRAAAEASGFSLDRHGRFSLKNEQGHELYSLGDRSGAAFEAASMKDATPQALTLSMDVPRTPDTQHAFQAMVRFGRQLASLLGGELVDDNSRPLDDRAIAAIEIQLTAVCRSLRAHGIAPGSELALRIFS